MDRLFSGSVVPNGIVKQYDKNHLCLSFCVDINQDNQGLDSSSPDYENNVRAFYKKFFQLSHYFTSPAGVTGTFEITTENGQLFTVPAILSNQNNWGEACDTQELETIRDSLWQNLFTPLPADSLSLQKGAGRRNIKKLAAEVLPMLDASVPLQKNVAISSVGSLNKYNTLHNALQNSKHADLSYTLIDSNGLTNVMRSLKQDSALNKMLSRASTVSDKYRELNQLNRFNFIKERLGKLTFSDESDVITLHRQATDLHLESSIDLNELFITYSQLSHHPPLMRLFGMVIDFTVSLDLVEHWGDHFQITFRGLSCSDHKGYQYDDSDWRKMVSYITRVKVQESPLKLAYLLKPKDKTLYQNTILNDDGAYLLNYDPMAQEQKLASVKEKTDSGITDVSGEFHDSFTRGIIYHHKRIADLILPPDNSANDLYEEHLTMGARVVAKNLYGKYRNWVSLTKRSTKVIDSGGATVYHCGNTESCIHFDHVSNYMNDQTGQIEHKTSEALFEFKGECLTLNTVFSRETKITKAECDAQERENPTDQSVLNSQRRMQKFLDIDYFPYDKKVREGYELTAVKLRYGLADGDQEDRRLPELIFGETYQFMVYNQYKNGWGLPLKTTANEAQASVDEIWHHNRSRAAHPRNLTLKFRKLENTKPIVLFSKRPAGVQQQEGTDDLTKKESLQDLILREGQIEETFRHVLPERTSLEHIYWAGILFKMSREERKIWKCRYNCGTGNPVSATMPCEEGCAQYCGGTKMLDYYPGDFIKPEDVMYLPDPIVDGFVIQLYWDAECTERYNIAYGSEALFEKSNDYTVRSFGLALQEKADYTGESAQIAVSGRDLRAVISLKPGMRIYGRIYNHTADPDKQLAWGHDYWLNQLRVSEAAITAEDFKSQVADPKDQPLKITLTNSKKTPLFKPEIYELFSQENSFGTPDPPDLRYITAWLQETVTRLQNSEYPCRDRYAYLGSGSKPAFELGKNILAIHPQSPESPEQGKLGSTNLTFELVSRFERIDALSINRFLPGAAPTGALELWMHKEEFADDPAQYVWPKTVAGTKSGDSKQTGHFPEDPMIGLNDSNSKTYHDYKFEFKGMTMKQLKTRMGATVMADFRQKYHREQTKDAFRDTITQLSAAYNTKTTKFELRAYELVNTSKFVGYYTDQPLTETTAGAYQLRSEKFPVLVLANEKPQKPDVAFLVTTIQRDYHTEKKQITANQAGNIVTVYLNRGRLSSGRDERVGILIKNESEYSKVYQSAQLLSMAGKDVVSDSEAPESGYIRYDPAHPDVSDISIPKNLKDNQYDARYEEDMGMMSYLPRFDTDRQLWKIEIEFTIRTKGKEQLHNPFVKLGLVHFQPFALNYNKAGDAADLNKDCRISIAETTMFCYLLPERNLSLTFKKPSFILDRWGEVDLTLSFDKSSLNYSPKADGAKLRSNFVLCVEGSAEGQFWYPLMSQAGNDDWQLMHPLIGDGVTSDTVEIKKTIRFQRRSNPPYTNNHNASEDHMIRYHRFRVRLVEVEWFRNMTWSEVRDRYQTQSQWNLLLRDVLEAEDLRVRYVELIY